MQLCNRGRANPQQPQLSMWFLLVFTGLYPSQLVRRGFCESPPTKQIPSQANHISGALLKSYQVMKQLPQKNHPKPPHSETRRPVPEVGLSSGLRHPVPWVALGQWRSPNLASTCLVELERIWPWLKKRYQNGIYHYWKCPSFFSGDLSKCKPGLMILLCLAARRELCRELSWCRLVRLDSRGDCGMSQ